MSLPLLGAGNSAPGGLTSSLVSVYHHDDLLGTDSWGTNTLTNNNTVTAAAAGKLSGASQFTAANSESYSIASNATLQVVDTSMFISTWVYLDSVGANRAFVCKYTGAGNFEYVAQYTSFNTRLGFALNGGVVYSDLVGAPSLSTWYHIIAGYDHPNQQLFIYVNDNAGNTASHVAGTLATTGVFALGRLGNSSTSFLDGRMDETAIWIGRTPTAAERTYLYNGGTGRVVV
jgi:hypothetical protein